MFNGQTGAALSTVNYDPPRGTVSSWGDTYGNRVDRFLAGTAYLDGQRPSLIMARGYYTRTVIAAWDFRNGTLTKRWTFDSNASGNGAARRPGQPPAVHRRRRRRRPGRDRLRRDGHRRQRPAAVDHRQRPRRRPARRRPRSRAAPAWRCSRSTRTRSKPSSLVRRRPYRSDHLVRRRLRRRQRPGRLRRHLGRQPRRRVVVGRRSTGAVPTPAGRTSAASRRSTNFLVWWDGDPVRELLDGTHIDKYGTGGDTRLLTGSGVASNNGTKSTPALSGDIFGDWREEVIWRTTDSRALRIYSTPTPTSTPDLHADARPAVPGGDRLAEHRLQPAAAPELLHRRRHGHPAHARTSTCADLTLAVLIGFA